MSKDATIYVYLLQEGVDVWRPVRARPLGGDLFRILSRNPDPEDEKWQFGTGGIVQVREVLLAEGSTPRPCLVAVALAQAEGNATEPDLPEA